MSFRDERRIASCNLRSRPNREELSTLLPCSQLPVMIADWPAVRVIHTDDSSGNRQNGQLAIVSASCNSERDRSFQPNPKQIGNSPSRLQLAVVWTCASETCLHSFRLRAHDNCTLVLLITRVEAGPGALRSRVSCPDARAWTPTVPKTCCL